jgi:hypothetical protein
LRVLISTIFRKQDNGKNYFRVFPANRLAIGIPDSLGEKHRKENKKHEERGADLPRDD